MAAEGTWFESNCACSFKNNVKHFNIYKPIFMGKSKLTIEDQNICLGQPL